MIAGMLKNLSLVFVGAGAGGALRYLMSLLLNPLLVEIPLGTLAVNVLGSGAAGALIGFLAERAALEPTLRPLLLAGFLGGLTTFSSFAVEVVQMLEAQKPVAAAAIVLVHVGASLAAAIAGLIAVRALVAWPPRWPTTMAPQGLSPAGIRDSTLKLVASTTDTSLEFPFAVYSTSPRGLSDTPQGRGPTSTVLSTLPVAISSSIRFLPRPVTAYRRLPSCDTTMPTGRVSDPSSLMVRDTFSAFASMTEMLPSFSADTKAWAPSSENTVKRGRCPTSSVFTTRVVVVSITAM